MSEVQDKDKEGRPYSGSNQLDHNFLTEQRENNVTVSASQISISLVREVAVNGKYNYDEKLFKMLEDYLQEKVEHQPDYQFGASEIVPFERSIAILIRYAPTAALARHYFLIALRKYKAPLRTPYLELILLTNLMYVYTAKNYMNDALELLQMALGIGVRGVQIPMTSFQKASTKSRDHIVVFNAVASIVLGYHNLEYTKDKSGFQPITQ